MAHVLKASYTAFKGAYLQNPDTCKRTRAVLIRLCIPAGALINKTEKQMNGPPRLKTRADRAKVVSIRVINRRTRKLGRRVKKAYAWYGIIGSRFVYTQGTVATPEKPFDRSHRFCGSGIHFFFDRKAAINFINFTL